MFDKNEPPKHKIPTISLRAIVGLQNPSCDYIYIKYFYVFSSYSKGNNVLKSIPVRGREGWEGKNKNIPYYIHNYMYEYIIIYTCIYAFRYTYTYKGNKKC